jgi:hypothetical protein
MKARRSRESRAVPTGVEEERLAMQREPPLQDLELRRQRIS